MERMAKFIKKEEIPAYIGYEAEPTEWHTVTYRSCQMFGGSVDYTLRNSGHVQSILNPPCNPKASFMTSCKPPKTAMEFLEVASKHQGPTYLTNN